MDVQIKEPGGPGHHHANRGVAMAAVRDRHKYSGTIVPVVGLLLLVMVWLIVAQSMLDFGHVASLGSTNPGPTWLWF